MVIVYGDVSNLNTSAVVPDYDAVNISVVNSEDNVVYNTVVTVGDLRSGYVLPLLNAGNYTLNAAYCTSYLTSG